ncbi:DUF2057 family protein [Vibrio rumoiensis]|uniref:Uncharacterized protein n=1 Tax=Vibrio rumoiensis 1S-45 TaxID=1188252 RepID=A0A1E5E108_9VIBR|nr:DUF2057 family protein [Vibrio rumoiensis]OEF24210.1 hypothetical protein A1QC_10585 [Vibrio rumoiensis 1S-45]
MKRILLFLVAIISTNAVASVLTIESGIKVVMINGQKVEEGIPLLLTDGQNQVVAEFSGRLVNKGKTEFISTPPYVMTFNLSQSSDGTLNLKPSTFSDLQAAIDDNSDIFEFGNLKVTLLKQDKLPKNDSFMPYSDVPQLVANYNAEHGFPFGIVEQQQKVALESKESLNNLKYWYQQASKQEKAEFKYWINAQ